MEFNCFSFVRVCCACVKALYLLFQSWYASCLIFLSAWYYTLNVYGITLGLDVGRYLSALYGSLDSSNYVKIEGLLLGDSLGSTGGKVLGSDEGIKLGFSDGKVISTALGNLNVIILRLNVGT